MTRTRYEASLQRQRIAVGESYLTPREYQIVAMYIDGVALADMPRLLACSRKTLHTNLHKAKDRLQARTIYQLIALVAVSDALRQRGRSSNRDAVTGNRGPGAAPSRAV